MLEPQLDGPDELVCIVCGYVQVSELELRRAEEARARRQEGRNDDHAAPKRDSA